MPRRRPGVEARMSQSVGASVGRRIPRQEPGLRGHVRVESLKTRDGCDAEPTPLPGVSRMSDQPPNPADVDELPVRPGGVCPKTPGPPGRLASLAIKPIPDRYFQLNGAILCERCSGGHHGTS